MSKVVWLVCYRFLGLCVFWFAFFLSVSARFYIFSYPGSGFYRELLLDGVSLMLILMLFFCGFVALFYCFHYFGGSLESCYLFPLIVWFISVMCLLVTRGGLAFSLVFWEYLGFVSFLLILFYSNGVRLRASVITLFASRFGDVCFFVLILWSSWWLGFSCLRFLWLVLLVVVTKSAAYPFMSWLLEAMRAPTPVRSLVHSSTLVAAGVWFTLRYSEYLSVEARGLLFLSCSLTVLLRGFFASFFRDLKKVVALSTCKNVSWCLIFFMCGDLSLCIFQLLTHGVCKCFLFMSVGDLMRSRMGRQRCVNVFLPHYAGFFGSFSRVLLVVSLRGLPFLGVFFSKHLFFSCVFYCFSFFGLFVLLCGFVLTYAYSVRLVLLLLRGAGGTRFGFSSSFLLFVRLVVFGSIVKFLFVASFQEFFVLEGPSRVVLVLLQVLGCLWGFLLFSYAPPQRFWFSMLGGGDCLVSSVYSYFLCFRAVSVLSFYRWEVFLFRSASMLVQCRRGLGSISLVSFNFVVYGLSCAVLFYSFLA